jgi:mannose-1-phosphate guanylyltransferase/mannose-6-phosphate isomerase
MTMEKRIVPLIMCGGAGTRLWPAPREVRSKQFLSRFGARSTFRGTLLRVSDATLAVGLDAVATRFVGILSLF